MHQMPPIERYLEGKIKGLKIVQVKRKPGAMAMACEFGRRQFAVGFKSPTGAQQMIEAIKKEIKK